MDMTKVPTVELVNKLTELDYDIESKILLYNNVCEELLRRFPPLEDQIEPKVLVKKREEKIK